VATSPTGQFNTGLIAFGVFAACSCKVQIRGGSEVEVIAEERAEGDSRRAKVGV